MNEIQYLKVDVSEEDDFVVATVAGEIDIASAPTLRAEIDKVQLDRHVLLDLAGVYFIDSTALHVFISAAVTREDAGGSLHVRQCSAPVRRLLELTGLEHLLLERARILI